MQLKVTLYTTLLQQLELFIIQKHIKEYIYTQKHVPHGQFKGISRAVLTTCNFGFTHMMQFHRNADS